MISASGRPTPVVIADNSRYDLAPTPEASMTARKPFTLIAAAIFLMIAITHLYRLYAGFQLSVGDWQLPQGASWVTAGVAGLLGVTLIREAGR